MRRLLQIVRFVRVAIAARLIQDALWGGAPGHRRENHESLKGYIDAIEKRVVALRGVRRDNPSWKVELRKRCLQAAAVSVALMEYVDAGGVEP